MQISTNLSVEGVTQDMKTDAESEWRWLENLISFSLFRGNVANNLNRADNGEG